MSVPHKSTTRQELGLLLRVLEGKPPRVPVELRPLAVPPAAWRHGQYVAAVVIAIQGAAAPRVVYGDEVFTDKATCEAHAIRVANDFAQCPAWNKKHAFTVTMQGART